MFHILIIKYDGVSLELQTTLYGKRNTLDNKNIKPTIAVWTINNRATKAVSSLI